MPKPRHEITADEETALLQSPRGRKYRRGPTPLPKLQIGILMLFQLAEPMTSHCIYPFINQLVSELDITQGDPRRVGYYAGLIQSLFFGAEALTVLHWSRLSDRIGRKPVLLIGLSGLCVSMILFGLSRTFWTLVLSRCLCGLLNGNIGVIKSMVGELTDSSNMAQAFGLMPVVWATGVTLAPLIGGTFARPHDRFPSIFANPFWQKYPYFLPCFISACFSAFAFFIALVFLKETVPARRPERSHVKPQRTLVDENEEYTAAQYGAAGANLDHTADSTPETPTTRHSRLSSSATAVEPDARSDDSADDAADGPVPFSALFTRPVLLSIAAYASLAVLDIAFGALQPLFYATPVAAGGLGFTPPTIGLLLGIFGVLNGAFQGLFFARIVRGMGLRRTLQVGLGAFAPLFALFPLANWVAREEGVGAKVWVVLVVQLMFCVVMDMSYGCVFMYITSGAPNKRSLGATNGLAQLTASIVRTIGPAASTSLFAVSTERGLLGGQLVYVVFVILAGCAVWVASRLPAEPWEKEGEDDRL